MIAANEILKKYWGYDAFHQPQQEIIEKVNENRDVLAVLPTGFGKSICFQIPTLQNEKGICLVISPLIALMKDQVAQLEKRNIKAVALNGLISINEQVRILDNVQFGNIKFLYIAPERLQSEFFQEKLRQLPITLIAIDEAHCISEWGHDFRPSYLKINILRDIFPKVNIIALTATATKRVINDVEKYLSLKNPLFFKKSSVRDNLKLKVIESPDKLGNLLRVLKKKSESVIIYAGTRKNVEQTSIFLNNNGFKSVFYHAGMDKNHKEIAFNAWFTEKSPIMVATNAFGMGIDKPNVRKVIHLQLPNSLENYIQEAGRAGRDKQVSEAYIIEEIADVKKTENLYFNTLPNDSFIKDVYVNLNQYYKIPYGELYNEDLHFNLGEFANQYNYSVVKAFYVLEILEREGILAMNQQKEDVHEVYFTADETQLFEYYLKNKLKEKIVKFLLRTYDGIFDNPTPIYPVQISKVLEMNVIEVEKHLNELHNDGMIEYHKYAHSNTLRFLVPREDQYTINRILVDVRKYIEQKREKYLSMIQYVTKNDICRNRQIADYFEETIEDDCGICDVCENRNSNKSENKKINKQIIDLLKNQNMLSTGQLVDALDFPDELILKVIRKMLDDEILILNSQNKISFNAR